MKKAGKIIGSVLLIIVLTGIILFKRYNRKQSIINQNKVNSELVQAREDYRKKQEDSIAKVKENTRDSTQKAQLKEREKQLQELRKIREGLKQEIEDKK
ncbi:hypothetical protein [Aquimarina brevivitae]|uniref:Uncharacterized protein n=1 Tax=Aquimarina brevivitae TaxID=323412 RepID=A0A4V2F7I1_9FLAO|nr:hypothetical protein [Aquimarina brevivitae]RZS99899.1 hypothetical protein EV197_1130 [Aquimarina brevivitae]